MSKAYLFNGMDEWYDKHRDELVQGKGFVGGHKKKHHIPTTSTKKEQAWTNKKIHYGNEHDKSTTLIRTWNKNGHVVSLWSDNNLTCDCKGWIFKRSGIGRECIHVRETYAHVMYQPVPDKSKPVKSDDLVNRIEAIILKGLG